MFNEGYLAGHLNVLVTIYLISHCTTKDICLFCQMHTHVYSYMYIHPPPHTGRVRYKGRVFPDKHSTGFLSYQHCWIIQKSFRCRKSSFHNGKTAVWVWLRVNYNRNNETKKSFKTYLIICYKSFCINSACNASLNKTSKWEFLRSICEFRH